MNSSKEIKALKIVLVNTSSRTGGAAVAAVRLLKALRKQGVDARMLVLHKEQETEGVESVEHNVWQRHLNRFRFYWERLMIFLCNHRNRTDLFRVSIANTGTDISRHPWIKDADVVHLHWINQGFLSLKNLKQLTSLAKPIVWTMHDTWPCTGICHNPRECTSYQTLCKGCFFLQNHGDEPDLSSRIFRKKKAIYEEALMSFVGCSRWLTNLARQSALTKSKRVVNIPNPIDMICFRPLDKMACREALGLPKEKHLVLFGALNVTDERKGVAYLLRALPLLNHSVELVVFGQVKHEIQERIPVPIHSLGYLTDETKIVSLYNAVDMFVTSSLDENLPNMIMEAMACGTPCIGFATGGIPEMIDHLQNGYVAHYKDETDLAKGIDWVLERPDRASIAMACVEKVRSAYTEKVVSEQYMELYREVLKR